MSAAVIDFATIRARRAAAAAEAAAAAQKRDPFSNPRAVLIARQILDWLIQDQERCKRSAVVAMMREFSISKTGGPS
jgi:hypothetical protein